MSRRIATMYHLSALVLILGPLFAAAADDGPPVPHSVIHPQRNAPMDFGDAPNTIPDPPGNPTVDVPAYPTLLVDDGARHVIVEGGPFLGSAPDAEDDGQPEATASADDTDGNDDEDGVTGLDVPMAPGSNHSIIVEVTAPEGAYLNAWVDFNGDGDWTDAGEHIFIDRFLETGSHDLSFAVADRVAFLGDLGGLVAPSGVARFRLSTQSGLTPAGLAFDGEVEDYRPFVERASGQDVEIDYRIVNSTLAFVRSLALPPGVVVDKGWLLAVSNALSLQVADDLSQRVGFPAGSGMHQHLVEHYGLFTNNSFLLEEAAYLGDPVTAVQRALLETAVELEADLGRPVEIVARQTADAGTKSYSLYGGVLATSDGTVVAVTGASNVAVYEITAEVAFGPIDLGDAPAPYPTVLAENGPRHAIVAQNPYMGSEAPDAEDNGRPDAAARGDDSTGSDDEDGILRLDIPLRPGFDHSVVVDVSADRQVIAIGAPDRLPAAFGGVRNAMIAIGNRLLVPAPQRDLEIGADTLVDVGAAYLFDVDTGELLLTIPNPDPGALGNFGWSATAVDGKFVISAVNQGMVYGFAPDSGVPILAIPDPTPEEGATFGYALATCDGDILATAYYPDQPNPVRVYRFDGETGTLLQTYESPGLSRFSAVAVGGRIAVPRTDNGSIMLFDPDTGNALDWIDLGDRFSRLAALGDKLVASAPTHDFYGTGTGRGSIYVFDPLTGDELLHIPNPDPDAETAIGDHVTTHDGKILVGVPSQSAAPSSPRGWIYVFDGATGALLNTIESTDPDDGEGGFGASVVGYGDSVLVADPLSDHFGWDSGAVFKFSLDDGAPQSFAEYDSAYLSGWVDFNADGDWDDPGEQVFDDELLTTGTHDRSFPVPVVAAAGETFARFRLSTQMDLTPYGYAPDGEVEDHRVTVAPLDLPLDFGDAPDTIPDPYDSASYRVDVPAYPTLLTDHGARHAIVEDGPHLGTAPDAEEDGQPGAAASGDDSAGSDDEDGVTGLDVPMVPGSDHPITVDVTAPESAYLNAWVDFNFDGDWDDPDERIVADLSLSTGTHEMTFPVPDQVAVRPSSGGIPRIAPGGFARFRICSAGRLGPNDLAADGEVEDYGTWVEEPEGQLTFDHSTVVTTMAYVTSLALPVGLQLTDPRLVAAGSPLSLQLAETLATETAIPRGPQYSQRLIREYGILTNMAYLTDDLPRFGNARDQLIDALNAEAETLTMASGRAVGVSVESSQVDTQSYELYGGPIYTRTGKTLVVGTANTDIYEITATFEFLPMDFGDAPAPYPTLLEDDGARHVVVDGGPELRLNEMFVLDADEDGQPEAEARGDDTDGNNDENGVRWLGVNHRRGQAAQISFDIINPTGDAVLNGWVDWNQDGDWLDEDEQIFTDLPLATGTHMLSINVPTDAALGDTFARFRLSTEAGLAPTGLAADGEVEDYKLHIEEAASGNDVIIDHRVVFSDLYVGTIIPPPGLGRPVYFAHVDRATSDDLLPYLMEVLPEDSPYRDPVLALPTQPNLDLILGNGYLADPREALLADLAAVQASLRTAYPDLEFTVETHESFFNRIAIGLYGGILEYGRQPTTIFTGELHTQWYEITVTLSAPMLTAAKADALYVDHDGDQAVDPGDAVRYTITIKNEGASQAKDLQLADAVDANATLVPGSENVAPLAVDDTYYVNDPQFFFSGRNILFTGTAAGAAQAGEGLFANDREFLGDTYELHSFDAVSTGGAEVDVHPDGTFTYAAAAPMSGRDTFTYTLVDSQGLTDTATVTVVGREPLSQGREPITVWHINDSGTSGEGTFENPQGDWVNADDEGWFPSDLIVFVHADSVFENPNGSIQIGAIPGQRLLGEADDITHWIETDQYGEVPLPRATSGTARPAINASLEYYAIQSWGVWDTEVAGFEITGVDRGLAVGGSAGRQVIRNVKLSDCEVGVRVRSLELVSVAFVDVEILNCAEACLQITDSEADIEFGTDEGSSRIETSTGAAISVGTGGEYGEYFPGTLIVHPTSEIIATGGTGLQFDGADGTFEFHGPVSLSGGAGIDITGGSSGEFSFTKVTIDGRSTAAVNVVAQQAHTVTALFDDLTITHAARGGVLLNAASPSTLNVTVTNSNIAGTGPGVAASVDEQADICLHLDGNTAPAGYILTETAGNFKVQNLTTVEARNTGPFTFQPNISAFEDVAECPSPTPARDPRSREGPSVLGGGVPEAEDRSGDPTPLREGEVNLDLGTLPPGETLTVTFDVTVNGNGQITNQATVSGANFATLLSDDPDTPEPDDPTVTAVPPDSIDIDLFHPWTLISLPFNLPDAGRLPDLVTDLGGGPIQPINAWLWDPGSTCCRFAAGPVAAGTGIWLNVATSVTVRIVRPTGPAMRDSPPRASHTTPTEWHLRGPVGDVPVSQWLESLDAAPTAFGWHGPSQQFFIPAGSKTALPGEAFWLRTGAEIPLGRRPW